MRVFPSEISIWICRQWSPLSSPVWPGHIQSTKDLHHLAQCNTPIPMGSPAMVLSLQPLGPHPRTGALSHHWWFGCIAHPHPNPIFMAQLISKHNKTANLVCLNLTGGPVCSAPVVWCVTIRGSASSGAGCQPAQTQSHGHLCDRRHCWPHDTRMQPQILPPHPRHPTPPLFTLKRSLINQVISIKKKDLNRIKSSVENNYFSLPACLQTVTFVFFSLQSWTYIINLPVSVLSPRNLLKFLMSDNHTPFLGLLLFYLTDSIYLFIAFF